MEQFMTVFVLVLYICVIENYLFTRAENDYIRIPAGTEDTLTCEDQSVIRIDDAVVDGDESSCESNACILNNDEFISIKNSCNGYKTCTVGFQKNISCVEENSNFVLLYSCLVPRNLLCTFEYSLCNWENAQGTDLQPWKIYSSESPLQNPSRLPKTDSYSKSPNGNYIYFEKQGNFHTAKLISGIISFDNDKCLVLWYKTDSNSELIIHRTSHSSLVFNLDTNKTNNDWKFQTFTLAKGTPADIILQGTINGGNGGYIAIDDIDIQEWNCNAPAPISCNFEENLCNFHIWPTYGLKWERKRAQQIASDGQPSVDNRNGHGFYVFTQSLSLNTSGNRLITIQLKNVVDVRCLSFWYYMYHKVDQEYGKLMYTVENKIGTNFSSIIDMRKMMWRQFHANVYNATRIILDYSYAPQTHGGVALDDFYISPVDCAEEPSFRNCVEQHDDLNIDCPDTDVQNTYAAFDPSNLMSCKNTIDEIYIKRQELFQNCSDTAMCFYTPTKVLDDKECFYMSKYLNLNYTCIVPPTSETNDMQTFSTSSQTDVTPTSETNDMQTFSTSSQTDDTTMSMAKWTQTVSSTSQTDDITGSFQSDSSSSTSVIGIVVGVVLSLITLSVLLVISVIYFRRSRYAEKKGHSIVANENNHNDYTGHQNTAFSSEVNVTTQTDYCEIRTSKHNDQYHDITDTFSPSINTTNDDEYSEIANVVNSINNPNASSNYQHQYTTLDPNATGFDRSNPQTNLQNESKINNNSNETTSFTGGDDYAILDPDDLNELKNNIPKVLSLSENYVVLDPNETGFNRKNTDTVCNYELATPLNPTESSEDPYDVSKDETYDKSSNSRHKEKDNNIYSHMVDNVYDTAGNQRKKEDNDGTYDHFFGQQSEDDYDISKPL